MSAPFQVGDRVRLNKRADRSFSTKKRVGTVVRVWDRKYHGGRGSYIQVERDGIKASEHWNVCWWDRVVSRKEDAQQTT